MRKIATFYVTLFMIAYIGIAGVWGQEPVPDKTVYKIETVILEGSEEEIKEGEAEPAGDISTRGMAICVPNGEGDEVCWGGLLYVINLTNERLYISRGTKGLRYIGITEKRSTSTFFVYDPQGWTRLWASTKWTDGPLGEIRQLTVKGLATGVSWLIKYPDPVGDGGPTSLRRPEEPTVRPKQKRIPLIGR